MPESVHVLDPEYQKGSVKRIPDQETRDQLAEQFEDVEAEREFVKAPAPSLAIPESYRQFERDAHEAEAERRRVADVPDGEAVTSGLDPAHPAPGLVGLPGFRYGADVLEEQRQAEESDDLDSLPWHDLRAVAKDETGDASGDRPTVTARVRAHREEQ
jgi:hypothetical protein